MSKEIYSAIMFYLYVGEKSRIAEIRFSTRTNVVSVIWLVASSSSSSSGLIGMLEAGWKHLINNIDVRQW